MSKIYSIEDIDAINSEIDKIIDILTEEKQKILAIKNQSNELPWMKIAEEELGITEIPGPEHCKRIIEYHDFTTGKFKDDETAWCSAFVCYCMEKSGIRSTRSALARSWLQWGRIIENPTYGCVTIFKRGTSKWQGHVAFYCMETENKILVLGGNQHNKVCKSYYSKNDLLGYRLP